MPMQFLSLTERAVAEERGWSVEDASQDNLRDQAGEALWSLYEREGDRFWPRRNNPGFPNGVPEMIRITDDAGAVLAEYSLKDMIDDNPGLELVGPP